MAEDSLFKVWWWCLYQLPSYCPCYLAHPTYIFEHHFMWIALTIAILKMGVLIYQIIWRVKLDGIFFIGCVVMNQGNLTCLQLSGCPDPFCCAWFGWQFWRLWWGGGESAYPERIVQILSKWNASDICQFQHDIDTLKWFCLFTKTNAMSTILVIIGEQFYWVVSVNYQLQSLTPIWQDI